MPKRRGFKPSEHFKDRLRKMRERGARDGVAPASGKKKTTCSGKPVRLIRRLTWTIGSTLRDCSHRSKAASVGGPFLVAAATDFFAFDRRNG